MNQAMVISALLLCTVLMGPGAAAQSSDSDDDEARFSIMRTRDLAFGRITADGSGALHLSASPTPIRIASGGVGLIPGGTYSSARFVVQGERGTEDGDVVIITLPQAIQIQAGSTTLTAEDIEAALDDVGHDWTELGGGRFLCTLSGGRRCAFVVGARLLVSDFNQSAQVQGAFRVQVEPLHRRGHHNDN